MLSERVEWLNDLPDWHLLLCSKKFHLLQGLNKNLSLMIHTAYSVSTVCLVDIKRAYFILDLNTVCSAKTFDCSISG